MKAFNILVAMLAVCAMSSCELTEGGSTDGSSSGDAARRDQGGGGTGGGGGATPVLSTKIIYLSYDGISIDPSDANLSATLARFDAVCLNDSNNPNLTNVKALLAFPTLRNPSLASAWPIKANTKYVQKDGVTETFTTGSTNVIPLPMISSMGTNMAPLFTGLTRSGSVHTENCGQFKDNTGSLSTTKIGAALATDADVYEDPGITLSCDNSFNPNFYCVEQ